jgi:glycosyltransferase involved in cell wall biosynthesis
MKIALIATYRPEECGIATFTENLLLSLKNYHSNNQNETHDIHIVAVQLNECDYPDEVAFCIRKDVASDYTIAADFLHENNFDFCIIQHEYGIFGGESGLHLLSLVNRLRIPFIVTAHTILKQPSVLQKSIIQTLSEKGEQIVVMTNKAKQFLRDVYEIQAEKISIIEHGVPEKIPVDKESVLKANNLAGKTVLMTFGLLGRNKGIETVIRALPSVIKKYPSVVYLVQGNTHPNVLKNDGEAYRNSLIELANELGVGEHVEFRKCFLTEEKLFSLLSSIDIYITPYTNEEQITSGTLSYAIGAGAAVLSTPYWHARELLADNRGMIFNFRDHEQLSELILHLLENPEFRHELNSNALSYAHHLRWKNVGKRYIQLLNSILKNQHSVPKSHFNISFKDPGLKHIIKLTDNIGIFQHAVFGLPNYHEGYCLDDNSRALIAMVLAAEQGFENETNQLAEVYLSFIHFMQKNDGWFHNFLSFERRIIDDECSEDAFGRTMWALGQLISSSSFRGLQQPAEEIFTRGLNHSFRLKHIRGIANTIIGLKYYLEKNPFHGEAHKALLELTGKMKNEYLKNSDSNWDWFAENLTYDNGILPMALFQAYSVTGDEEALMIALNTTNFLERELMKKGHLSLVGSNEWFFKNGSKGSYPQQAIDAMSMVLLFQYAYQTTNDKNYQQSMLQCYRWFFSENDLGISLYNPQTEGCYDGIEDYGINRNQGAESTLALFISHYSVCKCLETDNNPEKEKIKVNIP